MVLHRSLHLTAFCQCRRKIFISKSACFRTKMSQSFVEAQRLARVNSHTLSNSLIHALGVEGRRIRILYISTYPPTRCGIAEYTHFLVEHVRELSPSPDVYVAANAEAEAVEEDGLRVFPCFSSSKHRYQGDIIDVVESLNPPLDVVHIQHEFGIFHTDECFLELLEYLRTCSKVLVVTMHTVLHAVWGMRIIDYQRSLASFCDALVVHSLPMEWELMAQGVSSRKLYVIPHGTKLFDLPNKELAREKLGIPKDKFVALFFGFIRPDKGLDTLVSAAEKLVDRNVLVVFAGEPQKTEYSIYQDYAERFFERIAGLSNVMVFEGYVPLEKLEVFFAACDVVVLPYAVEELNHYSVSGVLHLALGSGKPIIAARNPRLIEYQVAAPWAMFTPEDSEELAQKIELFAKNPLVREKTARLVRLYAARTSWPRVAQRHMTLYRRLLARRRSA